MAAPKGHKRYGGRRVGTPNKGTDASLNALIDGLCGSEAVDCFKAIALIALQPHQDARARLLANKILIEYRHGKAPQPLTGPSGGPIPVSVTDHFHYKSDPPAPKHDVH